MQKHMKQLSDWLKEEEVKGHNSDDEDILNAKQEVLEVCKIFYARSCNKKLYLS